MIYFFARKQELLQCEIYPGRPHVLTYVDASGTPRKERFRRGEDLDVRWTEVQRELARRGWKGPVGGGAQSRQ